jgi:hypothetical protein
VAAVVLFKLDDFLDTKVLLQIEHVAGVRPAKPVYGLIVVSHPKDGVVGAGKQLQPLVLQAIGVLEFVHQDVLEAPAVMLPQQFVPAQQFVAPKQQFGEIDHAVAIALRLVTFVDGQQPAREVVGRVHLRRPQALLLG